MTPLEAVERALLAQAKADEERFAATPDDEIDAVQDDLLSEDVVIDGVALRIGGSPSSLARVAVTALMGGDWLERVLAEHWDWCSRGRRGETVLCECGANLGDHPSSVKADGVHRTHLAAAIRSGTASGPEGSGGGDGAGEAPQTVLTGISEEVGQAIADGWRGRISALEADVERLTAALAEANWRLLTTETRTTPEEASRG